MLELSLNNSVDIVNVCRALSTPLRIEILKILSYSGPLNIQEIAELLNSPSSTISTNVKAMEDAGLIISDKQPAKNGSNKICSPVYLDILINLRVQKNLKNHMQKLEMSVPIGNFHAYEVSPSCGYVLFNQDGTLNKDFQIDNKYAFLLPERIDAQLLWFRKGFVEYHIPVNQLKDTVVSSISFSVEICSEAPGYNDNWKSDITMWINDVEIGTWLSPADYGGKRGKITPEEWYLDSTQYGILTEWVVGVDGTYVNNLKCSDVAIRDLNVVEYPVVKMRIGVKETAENIGGINIFGEKFGNYPQNIIMTIIYDAN
ncbi:MAG: helix-turn-helix domain-containing protein [Lentimicrobiaceae bacterium]|nr:helix-turn-helix domain-containing protein [Lentimicrobiaceae bacterium]